MFSIVCSLFGIFLIFLAPTIMLLMWNSEKISVIKRKKSSNNQEISVDN